MNEYNKIIRSLEKAFQGCEKFKIHDLLSKKSFKEFSSNNVIFIIKHLISYDKLQIISSKDKKFIEYVIVWNKSKKLEELPKVDELLFDSSNLCFTFPPFDKFGILNHLKDKGLTIRTLKEEFLNLFLEAKSSIKICSPFLEWNGFKYFKDVLMLKARDKVKIDILSRQIQLLEKGSRFEDVKQIYKFFKLNHVEKNISIRNYYYNKEDKRLASSIHAKTIIIDETKAYIGSGEIRKNSFEKNFELGLILSGKKVKEIRILFDSIFSRSEIIKFE